MDSSRFELLEPIEAGDICCSCGATVAEVQSHFRARRVRGHPICGKPLCYDQQFLEWRGLRKTCKCPKQVVPHKADWKTRASGE
jgi:hypothetical protein